MIATCDIDVNARRLEANRKIKRKRVDTRDNHRSVSDTEIPFSGCIKADNGSRVPINVRTSPERETSR